MNLNTGSRVIRFSAGEGAARLDLFLARHLRPEGISREKIKRLIRDGKVRVNGAPAPSPKESVSAGTTLEISLPALSSSLTPEAGSLKVLYSDAALAVIDKEAGLTTHPAPGCPEGTLAHRLPLHFPELARMEGFRPGIVHRLDKDTGGLMIIALSEKSRLVLAALFAGRGIFKEYLALVHGVPTPLTGNINAPIGRDPARKTRMAATASGRPARSAYRVLYADPSGRFALTAVRIFSGRTHQVRVHMQSIGHPLIGDALYTDPRCAERSRSMARSKSDRKLAELFRPGRQMLHAHRLSFVHPMPGAIKHEALRESVLPASESGAAYRVEARGSELSFVCPPPRDFADCATALARRALRVVLTGSPGCGKSALLTMLAEDGTPVFSADRTVADLYAPGGDAAHLLRARYGDRFVARAGAGAGVDKKALGEAMAADAGLRREVENTVHPLVFHALQAFRSECDALCLPFAPAEVPLYFEAGGECGKTEGRVVTVGVHCPFPVRRERLMRLRGWSDEMVTRMESWQWPEDKKISACDFVADNTGSLEDLRREAGRLTAFLEDARAVEDAELERMFAALWDGRQGRGNDDLSL
ncbi:MAG: dephospho-CoA kinase [Desulfovibrio sp.]|jgi:23S rRNA pseudouridine1911/1915/1917 synthase|nr:dephospho-CoA kinase [Desulfovibrio sp.]